MLDTLYAHNGTFYIISDQPPDDFPPIREMISSGWPMYNGKEDVERREPTGRDMQVITPRKAVGLFGKGASRISGVSVSERLGRVGWDGVLMSDWFGSSSRMIRINVSLPFSSGFEGCDVPLTRLASLLQSSAITITSALVGSMG